MTKTPDKPIKIYSPFVELDRVEQERQILIKRIKDGQASSNKKSGRAIGKLDKMTEELKNDIIKYTKDRTIKTADLLKKHKISRNTFKKYLDLVLRKKDKNEKK